MAYVDISTLQTIAAGQPLSAATVQAIRDSLEFFIDPPSCSVFHSTVQSVPNNSATALLANSENFDNDSMHSTSSNTSRITIQTAGRYMVFAQVEFATHVTGVRSIEFKINNTTAYPALIVPTAGGGVATTVPAIRAFTFAAGDYIETLGYQNTGGNLDVALKDFSVRHWTR